MESLHKMDALLQENRALREENERLRAEMEEALDIVSAIRQGQIDALVVQGTGEDRVYTLQSADQTYRMFVEHMQEGALTLVTDGIVYYANAAFARLLETPLETVIGTSVRQYIPEAERPMFDALIRQCLEGSSRGEINLQKSDGSVTPVYISLNPLHSNETSPICMVLTDLSEQKRNEQILANERQFREILNQTADGIVVYDTEGRVLFANAAAYTLLKDVSQEALIPRARTREGEEAIFENEKTLWTHAMHGERFHGVEVRIEIDETDSFDALLSANPLRDSEGAVIGVVLTFTDITERKRAEERVVQSSRRFRLLSDTASLLLRSEDPQRTVQELCEHVLKELDCHFFFNYLLDEKTQKLRLNAFCGITSEMAQKCEWLDIGAAVCGCVARDGVRVVAEHVQTSDDPRTNLVRSFGVRAYACHPFLAKNGCVVGTLSFGTLTRDTFTEEELALMKTITDQVAVAMESKRVKEELRRRAEEVEKLMNVAPVAIWVSHDPQCSLLMGNRAANELFGLAQGENISATLTPGSYNAAGRFYRNGRELMPEELPMQVSVRENKDIQDAELDMLLPSGHWVTILGNASPLRDEENQVWGCVGAFIDITQRKKMEKKLQEFTEDLEVRIKERTQELSRNQARLQHLVSELALTEQREKKRLSQELHDYLAQLLVLSRMKLDSIHRKNNKEDILPLVEEVKSFMDQSLVYTRNLIADLNPRVLEDSDLLTAVHWLAEQMKRHDLEVFVLDKRWKAIIKGERSILLFQIVRELLMNVVKHAQVKQAFVIFDPINAETGEITVLDHGVGFDAPSDMEVFASKQHFGLFSIQERLEAIQGRFEVVSVPSEGTQMKLVVPLGVGTSKE